MKVLAVGDSHSQYFGITPQLRGVFPALGGIGVELKTIHGATIAGFGKRSSTLGTRDTIVHLLKGYNPDFLVLNFGQVDIELGVPYRKYVKCDESDVDLLIKQFVNTYQEFISCLDFPSHRICVKGINLSVLSYDRNKTIRYIQRIVADKIESTEENEAIFQRMTSHFPNDVQRASIVTAFNRAVERGMRTVGASYFDINNDLQDEKSGLISPKYIPSGRDHHLVDSIDVRRTHWRALLALILQKNNYGYPEENLEYAASDHD